SFAGLALIAASGAIFGATLVRLAPGFDVDDREFDPRLSQASIQALRDSRAENRNLFRFYANYLRGVAHGDFGISYSLKRPVGELLTERGPVTIQLAAAGFAGGWALGLGLAIAAQRRRLLGFAASSISSLLLCLPAALIGLLILFVRGSWWWAIALVL